MLLITFVDLEIARDNVVMRRCRMQTTALLSFAKPQLIDPMSWSSSFHKVRSHTDVQAFLVAASRGAPRTGSAFSEHNFTGAYVVRLYSITIGMKRSLQCIWIQYDSYKPSFRLHLSHGIVGLLRLRRDYFLAFSRRCSVYPICDFLLSVVWLLADWNDNCEECISLR